MANRATGTFTFAANFETEFQGPLDARLTTPELPQLTDGSLPFAYNGMCVAVTLDEGRAEGSVDNNGLYILIDGSATPGNDINKWTKLGDAPGGGGNPVTAIAYTAATGELKVTLTHDGTANEDPANPLEFTTTIDLLYTSALPVDTQIPTAVGGFSVGETPTDLNGKTQSEMWDKLLFPTVYPTGSGASTTLNDSYGLQEIQKTLQVVLTSSANQGTLSNPSGPWAGNVNNAVITGPGPDLNPAITPPASLGDVTVVDHVVTQGTQSWTLTTSFDQGPMPVDSTGADYPGVRFNAQNKTNSTSFEGVWPIYVGLDTGEANLDKIGLKSQSANNIPISQNYGETASLNHRIAVPVDMIQGGDITIELDAGQLGWQASYSAGANAGGWVRTTVTFDVHAAATGIQYYLYTKSGTTGGANGYRINW